MRRKRGWMTAALVVAMTGPAWAARTPIHEAADSAEYGRKFGGMIGRGLLNVSTCFVDLLVNVVNETKNGPPLVGTLVGVGKGAGCTVLRAASGVIDVATFWVPGFNGFPVSDSYEDCLLMRRSAESVLSQPGMEPEPGAVPMAPSPSAPSVPEQVEKPRYTK